MTTPAEVPPWDEGNALLAEQPSQLTTSPMDCPQGQRLCLTVRTTSATISVLLSKAEAAAWGARISSDAAGMSGSGLVVANGALKP